MSERPLEYLKCYLGDISACTGPTVKYDLWNSIRISQPIHFSIQLGNIGPLYTWKCIQTVRNNFSVHLTKLRTDKNICLSVRMTGTPTRVFNTSAINFCQTCYMILLRPLPKINLFNLYSGSVFKSFMTFFHCKFMFNVSLVLYTYKEHGNLVFMFKVLSYTHPSKIIRIFGAHFKTISPPILFYLITFSPYIHTGPFVRCFTRSLSSSTSMYYFTLWPKCPKAVMGITLAKYSVVWCGQMRLVHQPCTYSKIVF